MKKLKLSAVNLRSYAIAGFIQTKRTNVRMTTPLPVMGDDFMLYGTSQTFSQDNTSICLQLRIINDRIIEETESFAIAISLDRTYDSIVGVNRTDISIADDDCKFQTMSVKINVVGD